MVMPHPGPFSPSLRLLARPWRDGHPEANLLEGQGVETGAENQAILQVPRLRKALLPGAQDRLLLLAGVSAGLQLHPAVALVREYPEPRHGTAPLVVP